MSEEILKESRAWAVEAALASDEKSALDIVVMDVSELLVVTDYFVVCTGRTDIQVKAISDNVEEMLRTRCGIKPIGIEGLPEAKWVLIDFGDLVVHVFQPEEREFYRLEKLWGEAPRVETGIPATPSVSAAKAE